MMQRRRSPLSLIGLLLSVLAFAGCGTAFGAAPAHHAHKSGRVGSRAGRRRRRDGSRGTKAPTPALPPLPEPTAQKPMTVLVVGDSLGEDLGMGLRDLIGAQPDVRLYTDAVGSTGLVDTAYYNWPAALANELRRYRPELVVALFGGNDALSFDQGGSYVPFGSTLWREDYGGRIAAMLRESRQAGARVVWVGLPMMAPASVLSNRSMEELNAVYAAEAAANRGVAYVSTWSLFATPQGQYAADLRDSAGQIEVVRDPDGVHIAPSAGTDLIATAVLAGIDAAEGIRLCPRTAGMWQGLLPKECLAAKTAAAN